MKKMNKKGFTLIEMLVVIAIIAVLVAIIIPTVTSATDKAQAAANAANLRSIKAEIVTAMLTDDDSRYSIPDADGNITIATDASGNAVVTLPFKDNTKFTATKTGDNVEVKYDGKTIAQWAAEAE